MGKIVTAKGLEILFDDEDFELVSRYSWWVTKRGYVQSEFMVNYQRYFIKLHRLLMKVGDDQVVDHVNGNKLDNRKVNLRVTSQAMNCRNNKKPRANKTSRFKGVSLGRGGVWIAQIQVNKKKLHIGRFHSEEEAALSYNSAALIHHGQFASLNIV